jgi:hypothetical protein
MMRFSLIIAGLSMVSGAAVAQIAAQPVPVPVPPAKIAKSKSDLDKVICRSQDTLGSRLQAHQVCMTLEQWQQYQYDNRDKAAEMQGLSGLAPSH